MLKGGWMGWDGMVFWGRLGLRIDGGLVLGKGV